MLSARMRVGGGMQTIEPHGRTLMHPSTFEHLKPTDTQLEAMARMRAAFLELSTSVDDYVPEGPDRTYLQRKLRECGMWANVAITRNPDGSPRA
jgi:hypothetical protein